MSDSPDSQRVAALTPRQRDVLDLVARGLTNSEIGQALNISPATVRTHVTAVLKGLDVTNRVEAALVSERVAASLERMSWLFRRPGLTVRRLRTAPDDDTARIVAFGLTEDLIDRFSRHAWFPVVREAGNKTDTLFAIDGSVRRHGNSWRITIRIEQSPDGECVWTERFTLPRSAVPTAHDMLTEQIVAVCYPTLLRVSGRIASRRVHTPDAEVWELNHAGLALLEHATPGSNEQALSLFRRSQARDSEDAIAEYGIGLASYSAFLNQWGDRNAAADELERSAERCVQLRPDSELGYFLVARAAMARGSFLAAIGPLQRAVSANPSFGTGHSVLGQNLMLCGRIAEGDERMRYALRLGPDTTVAGLIVAHFCCERYAQAIEAADTVLIQRPRYVFAHLMGAVSAWWTTDASAHARMSRLCELAPDFSIEGFVRAFGAGGSEPVLRVASAYEALAAR